MTSRDGQIVYDPTHPSVLADPYPLYCRLREEQPVHWEDRLGVWVVSRHADVSEMLRDPRWSSDYLNSVLDDGQRRTMREQSVGRVLLFLDGEEHAELRRLWAKSLGQRLLRDVETDARKISRMLLDQIGDRPTFDLIGEFAGPLALRVLSRLIGVPAGDVDRFADSAHELARMVDWNPVPDIIAGANDRALALAPYFVDLIRRKRIGRGNDLLTAWIERAKSKELRYADIVASCLLLLAAGQMTFTHMIGNGILALLHDADAFRAFRRQERPTVRMVDELLRYDAPVQVTPRTALEDMQIRGVPVRRGDLALALLGSANRDPAAFPDPDRIDFDRDLSASLSFGAGPHFCFGSRVARLAGAAAFEEVFDRFDNLAPFGESPRWQSTITQRGLERLVLCIGADRATVAPRATDERGTDDGAFNDARRE